MDRRFTIAGPSVLSERESDEVLVINLSSGCYFHFRGLSADVWEDLCKGYSARELLEFSGHTAANASGYGSALISLVDTLVKEGLLLPRQQAAQPAATATLAECETPWNDPAELQYEKYDDLKALLLADPIHEIRLMDVADEEK